MEPARRSVAPSIVVLRQSQKHPVRRKAALERDVGELAQAGQLAHRGGAAAFAVLDDVLLGCQPTDLREAGADAAMMSTRKLNCA